MFFQGVSLFFLAVAIFFGLRVITRHAYPLVALWRRGFVWRLIWTRLPVSPLTRAVTSRRRVEQWAREAQVDGFLYERILRYKEAGSWLALALAAIIWVAQSHSDALWFWLVSMPLVWWWPELYLLRCRARQKMAAEKDLSNLIEILRLVVLAGNNLEGAFRRAAERANGVWGRELRRGARRLDYGVSFDSVVADIAYRCRVPSFTKFILALKQSLALGASLSGTLAVQAALLRSRRKERAEELARTAAVKIAIPLVLCIFPSLIIIYLAPAILRFLGDI